MKRILLTVVILLLVVVVTIRIIYQHSREKICAQQFDFVLGQLKMLYNNKYPILASFEKDAKIFKEGNTFRMYYSLQFTKNMHRLKVGQVHENSLPYADISFRLSYSDFSIFERPVQAVFLPIDCYLSGKNPNLVNKFKSGIHISGLVDSDDISLQKEIHGIFDKVVHRILEWEKSPLK
jgi:hypothetical protein